MANSLKLYVDTQNNKLVVSDTDASAFTLPTLFQGDVLAVELKLLEPNTSGGLSTPFNVITTSYTLKLAIGTPDPSSSTVFTSATLTFDSGTNIYSGNLILNNTGTPSIASLLSSATSATATFEIEVSGGGNYSTEVQETVTVKADAIKTGTPMTPPVTGYYTEAESDATFVARSGNTTIGTLASTSLALANTTKLKFQHLNDTAITGMGNHTLNPSDAVFVKMGSLSGAANLCGISGGEDGRFLIVYNSDTSYALTVIHDSTSASAANRIYTMSAANTTITARGSATFIYDTEVNRWILLALNP
ncbi:hypothetical protein N8697_00740 [bacterium]|nr:hypothetical protein [bacterium]